MTRTEMFTYTQAAEALGTSTATVSRLVTSGKLGSVRAAPRTVRVPAAALEKFMREGGVSRDGTLKGRT